MFASFLSCFPRHLLDPEPAATIAKASITLSVVERDMWDYYDTGNEKYRAAVEHRAIGWERSGFIPKGSIGGKQPLKPDVSPLTFPPTQRERRATLMALQSENTARQSGLKEHNQALPERMRAATVPLLSSGMNLSPSKPTVRKWVREAKIDDEESSSESNSEAEDGEPDWMQVNASKGYGSAAYFVRRDHRKTKAVRERGRAELAKMKAAKIAERAKRAIAAEKAYDEHNEKFPTRPTSGKVTKRLTYQAKVEHVEDVADADDADEVFDVTTIFAKETKDNKLVRFSDRVVNKNAPLLRRVSILKSKAKAAIENINPKTPKLHMAAVPTSSQRLAANTAEAISNTSGASLSTASIYHSTASQGLTAYTAPTVNNTTPIIVSSSYDLKGKRKATPAENRLIETERSLYGWYAPPYLAQGRT